MERHESVKLKKIWQKANRNLYILFYQRSATTKEGEAFASPSLLIIYVSKNYSAFLDFFSNFLIA